jgi:MSHA pilin protein MshA
MKVSIKSNAQGGFTLIELIVVIVILGILAATALPKFASMAGDARWASVNAARGALSSTGAMAHAKYLVDPTVAKALSLTVEGTTMTLTSTGYPQADANVAAAAGLADGVDYKVLTKTTATGTNDPVPTATQITLVPISIYGTATAKKCFVTYDSGTTPPTVTATGDATVCN